MANVLLTGASGFVGGHLLRELLANGHRVRALSRSPASDAMLADAGAEPVRGNLQDHDTLNAACRDVEAVFHCAANTSAWSRDREVQNATNIDGTRAAEVTFKQVRVPASALLGTEGEGLPTLEYATGRGILALCAESLGAMEVAKAQTIDYLQTRKQFGKAIGSFQALQHRAAELWCDLELTRAIVRQALQELDQGTATAPLRVATYVGVMTAVLAFGFAICTAKPSRNAEAPMRAFT